MSTRRRDVKDGKGEDATRQPEQLKAFRDTWELGIHSYLAYLRDRLVVARDLLSDTGSVFVQIGDENVHVVRSLLDEVFGAENFVTQIAFRKTAAVSSPMARVNALAGTCDFVVWYGRDISQLKYRQLYLPKSAGSEGSGEYVFLEDAEGTRRKATSEERGDPSRLPAGARLYRQDNLTSPGFSETLSAPFTLEGTTYELSGNIHWKTTLHGLTRLALAKRVERRGVSLAYVRYLDDFPVFPLVNVWLDTSWGFGEDKTYVVQTGYKVVQRCMLMCTDPGDLVIDPTCGSGTTAYVAELGGRRWITVDTSRVALSLARTRVMSGKFPYYLLADSLGGALKDAMLSGRPPSDSADQFHGDIGRGFIYERVPHVTLKSIANNPDIHEGMRSEDVAAAVARHADTELLYDRPFVDPKVVRVAGPFTVESLSPHRALADLSGDASVPAGAVEADAGRFVGHILDSLRVSGVQNTVRDERLQFEPLESWPGIYIQAHGNYKEDGASRTAAVCIGPEHGTVGTELVREAAKEAAKTGADVLVVCGFAFEPLVADEARQFGRLTVLNTKMNPDLQMPDLLKKTGAGNLFMVFGEPDIDVRPANDDRIQVEIRGVDVYDPTTGQVRSHSTDDIACWFIDTHYNGESFFVRHAYFSGGDDPYDKLERALKADIDEEAWASLYSTTSRPFPKPSTGKIAVKVINHYGDEVMKVYDV